MVLLKGPIGFEWVNRSFGYLGFIKLNKDVLLAVSVGVLQSTNKGAAGSIEDFIMNFRGWKRFESNKGLKWALEGYK